VRSFAEGFHAADVNEIGVHELGEATAGGEGLNGVEAFRLVGPYRSVLEADLPANVGVELLSSVQEIRQLRGAVDIAVRDGDSGKVRRLEARSVLVAVPHAVLAAPADSPAGIRWDPQPACLRAARVAIRTGHVSRLSLRFRSRFWEELGGERPVSFLHAADPLPYPTWWTRAPVRSSVLVAWQGGPCAAELSGRGAPARLAIALRTLASLTGREEKFLRAELVQCLEHDWTSDPFSGGAYTYVACRGSAAAKMFQAGSGEGGVFFAGEATVNGPDRGTVHGAIRSGEIAAAACLAYLSGKARTLRESA
jgi:monoamine oxidase